MGMFIKDAKEVKSIFAAVPFREVNDFHLYGKATQTGTPTPDTPIKIDVPGSSGSIVVNTVGKNLSDLSKIGSSDSKAIIEKNSNSLRIYNTESSAYVATKEIIDLSKMKVGKIYTASADVAYSSGKARIALRNVKNSNILEGTSYVTESGKLKFTFVLPDTDCYLSLFATGSIAELGDVTYSNIQIEEGVFSTGYEPYKEVKVTLQTPNGLAGIPISSGGNYTDSNGQQWICDEITNEEIIKRVGKKKITSDLFWMITSYGIFYTDGLKNLGLNDTSFILCTHAIHTTKAASKMEHGESKFSATNLFYLANNNIDNIDDFKSWLDNNDVYIYYALPEAIHTPLTADEMAEIEKLSEIYPANNVSASDICDLSLNISTYYETKKIASAWANKDGVPAKVFSGMKKIVCVGKNGTSYCSKDNGKTWKVMNGADETLNHVTYGNGRFLAVGNNKVYYSLDGESWIESKKYSDMSAISFGKGMFIMAQKSGVNYSTDCENWSLVVNNNILRFNKIAYGNDIFVATGTNKNSLGRVFVSSDGKNWTEHEIYGVTGDPVTFGKGKFVNVSSSDAAYSTNGTTWNRKTNVFKEQMYDVTYGNNRFVAVGNGAAYYSLNGESWLPMSGVPSAGGFYRVSYGNGIFIAVGYLDTAGKIYQSLDGETWEEIQNIEPLTYYGICFAIDGGYDNH